MYLFYQQYHTVKSVPDEYYAGCALSVCKGFDLLEVNIILFYGIILDKNINKKQTKI